jgi:hypothetical protein
MGQYALHRVASDMMTELGYSSPNMASSRPCYTELR